MRRIGLLGGMSWESTLTYYRLINEAVREARGGLSSADLVLHSLDFQKIVDLQRANKWDEAAQMLSDAAIGLQKAGAEMILICTNTMHLVAPEVKKAITIPLIDIIEETAKALLAKGKTQPLLLATRYTMEHGFYVERMKTYGIEVIIPNDNDRTITHNIIFDELCQGQNKPCSRDKLLMIADKGMDGGADCLILGCTELGLCLSDDAHSLRVFDSTHIHAKAGVDYALTQAEIAQKLAS